MASNPLKPAILNKPSFPRKPSVDHETVYIALYDFKSENSEELEFFIGDLFVVLDFTEPEWWKAKSLRTNQLGLIPKNFIEKMKPIEIPNKPSLDKACKLVSSQNTSAPPEPNQQDIHVAIYDYVSNDSRAMEFFKGDKFLVLEANTDGWWLVKRLDNEKIGYIPGNYVEKHKPEDKSEKYMFGPLKRDAAERMLATCGNGTFIVRNSENRPSDYTLSVKDDNVVEHYPIVAAEPNGGFYIVQQTQFSNIDALITHYSSECDRLSVQLTIPCDKQDKLLAPLATGPTIASASSIVDATNKVPPVNNNNNNCRTLQFQQEVGVGKSCKVFRGIWEGQTVAIKKLTANNMTKAEFLQEVEILKKLNHPNLLGLHAVCTHENTPCIILQFMSVGSLQAYLKNCSDLQTDTLINFAVQIVNGMVHMEYKNCIHRNLATRNILVGETESQQIQIKIADFGLAKFLGNEQQYTAGPTELVPLKWTAPEAVKNSVFSIKSDVWSFGIVLYELWTGAKLPYKGIKNVDLLNTLTDGYRLPMPPSCPTKVYQLMKWCWEMDPSKRPMFRNAKMELEINKQNKPGNPIKELYL